MSSTSPSRILRRRTLIAWPDAGFSRIALDRIASWRTRESTETESRASSRRGQGGAELVE